MNNFTPRAQQVLALARKEADRFNHNFVGTEHLLLGLIKLGQGVAVNVLQKMGLDLETVRMEVEKQVGTGPDQKMIGNIPYTPRVKKVLALAATEARALNHTYVGTEHILLGLLREADGVAALVLADFAPDIAAAGRCHTAERIGRRFAEKLGVAATREAIAAFYRAYNKLGFGFLERVCAGALTYELERAGRHVPPGARHRRDLRGCVPGDVPRRPPGR